MCAHVLAAAVVRRCSPGRRRSRSPASSGGEGRGRGCLLVFVVIVLLLRVYGVSYAGVRYTYFLQFYLIFAYFSQLWRIVQYWQRSSAQKRPSRKKLYHTPGPILGGTP